MKQHNAMAMVKVSQFLILIIHILVITEYVFSSGMVRICYYNAVARYRTGHLKFDTYNIDYSLCTHYVYAHALIYSRGWDLIPIHSQVERKPTGAYQNFTGKNLPKRRTALTLLSIGGPNETERSELVKLTQQSEWGMEMFCSATIRLLRDNGFDGLDIDFAYPPEGNIKSGFVHLLQIMRATFDNKNPKWETRHLITLKLPPIYSQVVNAFDAHAISKYVDYISIAAYDLPPPSPKFAFFGSPLYADTWYPHQITVNSVMRDWLRAGLPAQKTVLGITPVGRVYALSNKSKCKPGSPISKEWFFMGHWFKTLNGLSYPEICLHYPNITSHFDTTSYMTYLTAWETFVGYEDQTSIMLKIHYAHDHDMAGVMFPAIEMDDVTGKMCNQGPFPLLHALKEETERIIRPHNKVRASTLNKAHTQENSHFFIIIILFQSLF